MITHVSRALTSMQGVLPPYRAQCVEETGKDPRTPQNVISMYHQFVINYSEATRETDMLIKYCCSVDLRKIGLAKLFHKAL